MRLWHRHKYVEMARTYAAPRDEKDAFWLHDPELRLMLLAGTTTVLLRCSDEQCGKTKKVQMLGKSVEADVLERMVR